MPSLPVTTEGVAQPVESSIDSALKSLFGTMCLGEAEEGKWSERQDSNLSTGGENKGKSSGDAQRDAQKIGPGGAELSHVAAVWPKLPVALKAAILAIVKSVEDVP